MRDRSVTHTVRTEEHARDLRLRWLRCVGGRSVDESLPSSAVIGWVCGRQGVRLFLSTGQQRSEAAALATRTQMGMARHLRESIRGWRAAGNKG